ERDLERVAGKRLRISKFSLGSATESLLGCWCPTQSSFSLPGPPGSICNPTKGDTGVAHDATTDIESRSNRDEREGIGSAVADLAIASICGEAEWWQIDSRNQLAVFENGVALRLIAG